MLITILNGFYSNRWVLGRHGHFLCHHAATSAVGFHMNGKTVLKSNCGSCVPYAAFGAAKLTMKDDDDSAVGGTMPIALRKRLCFY
jgi:hypothetical protein